MEELKSLTGSEQGDYWRPGDSHRFSHKWQKQLDDIEYNIGKLNQEREETRKQIEKYTEMD